MRAAKKTRPDTERRHALLVADAIQIVQGQMANGVSLESVARDLRVERSHLSRIFHKQKRVPFSVYLRRERLRKAKALLSDHQIRIKEVGSRCGFKNPDYFSDWFKKQAGESPSAIRSHLLSK